ncbi:MAG TPA: RelA/SpoT family protein [Flavobacteriales bacterium]|nr:RelA/SpoT family protein [Flavobacteriales bacterium]HRJ34980.1 bifunctional (p)ppGpp synthetase/guanosine-3',5'-bis(diphosphate) 3'-pyrophosphohydrolase [Flavobacteriales bacterium]HRJ37841.1 bifunctional (p)ppGpp synthetase/guanosine-3',5'-bis(diphosphate) 3'-pyrophosphohydrolase [Flavobacteriales bacterium]
MKPVIDPEKERQEILNAYRGLLRSCRASRDREDTDIIRKAFNLAVEKHKNMRRKSGEPYIFHPIAVARICSEEIGLGATSIVAALLHDTVEDTDLTLEDVEDMFGKKVAKIIDGLTKITGFVDNTESIQAENFRKVLLTMAEDVRVILIKLADRLHNMRTLGSMSKEKQLKIASETEYLYAPLAHRLGLNAIKTELEDLSLKFREPAAYNDIQSKLQKTQAVRNRFIAQFVLPIKRQLDKEGFNYVIKSRTKSVFSIWKKIHQKNVPFDEIYDLFAIRVILNSENEREKSDCWRVYSIVTDYYQPNPDRLRDWISTPKGNGYESLHTTVMSPTGKWVEVQIRTKRMDEIAERGYAAHWKYKENNSAESGLDSWLNNIRELLENPQANALDFLDEFKLNLFSEEIFVFTPKGELRTLPSGATALDFAFDIHSKVGESCIGAKVNTKLVPLSHPLNSGDQIEVITSKKQKPKEDWLKFVTTAKARQKIKDALKEEKKIIAREGKEMLIKRLEQYGILFSEKNIRKLEDHFNSSSSTDFYYRIAKGSIELGFLRDLEIKNGELFFPATGEKVTVEDLIKQSGAKDTGNDLLVLGDDLKQIDYKLSPCCNPIPGDDVFGFVTVSDGIKIHRVTCPNAVELMSNYGYRIVKARWKSQEAIEFLAGVHFKGIDDVGLVNKITSVISKELNINMRSIFFESHDGVFEGKVLLYVHDTHHLDRLMQNLLKIEGVHTVTRIDNQ